MEEELDLTQLGRRADIPAAPDEAVPETVANPHPGEVYPVRFACPEFTAPRPITGQPDFARFAVDDVPAARPIESKSLKLYRASFGNRGDFHADRTLAIANMLKATTAPRWLRIGGYRYLRGGIPSTSSARPAIRRPAHGCPTRAGCTEPRP